MAIDHETVGREGELQRLHSLIDEAVEHGGALLIIGDPGIGKSTLLRAAADHAGAAGFLVLATTGVESEASLPYAGLYEVIRSVLDNVDGLPHAQRSWRPTTTSRTTFKTLIAPRCSVGRCHRRSGRWNAPPN